VNEDTIHPAQPADPSGTAIIVGIEVEISKGFGAGMRGPQSVNPIAAAGIQPAQTVQASPAPSVPSPSTIQSASMKQAQS